MVDEITTPSAERSKLRIALAFIAAAVIVVAVLVIAFAAAAMNESTAPDTSLERSLPPVETTETPLPRPRKSERGSFFDSDPLEGVDCVREPLIMRTDDTSVGKLLSKDEIALITCAQ